MIFACGAHVYGAVARDADFAFNFVALFLESGCGVLSSELVDGAAAPAGERAEVEPLGHAPAAFGEVQQRDFAAGGGNVVQLASPRRSNASRVCPIQKTRKVFVFSEFRVLTTRL